MGGHGRDGQPCARQDFSPPAVGKWGVETRGTPSETPQVGICAAHHNLSFDAHYGPYSGTGQAILGRNGSDFAVGIHGSGSDFGYSVRPFAASVAVTSDATNVTFTSNSRVTDSSNTSALSAAQAAALTAGVLPCLRYLGRLRTRCEKRFAPDDPLYQAVFKAYDAVHGLRVMVH